MRRVFVKGRRVLLLGGALAVAAAVSGGTTAHAATTAPAASKAVSGTPCSFNPVVLCQSTNGIIALNITYTNASDCTFTWDVAWGDGTVSDVTDTDPANGSVLLAHHTYAKAATYAISATGHVTAGTCTTTPFSGHFSLVKPPPPVRSAPGEACVFDAPNGGLTTPGHLYVSGHVGWAYLSNPAKGTWVYGANEGPSKIYGTASKTWIGSGTWANALSIFKNALGEVGKSKTYFHTANYYKSYRCVTVPTYHSANALALAKKLGGVNYTIPGFDCLAQAADVLAKYGAPMNSTTYMLNPSDWQPNTYYTSVYMKKFGPAHKI
jgi:hypothetical protein